jgi:DNA-directed RNA polymerase alpha subunit
MVPDSVPTTELKQTTRYIMALSFLSMDYPTVGDLRRATDEELLRCPLIGRKTVEAIRGLIGPDK